MEFEQSLKRARSASLTLPLHSATSVCPDHTPISSSASILLPLPSLPEATFADSFLDQILSSKPKNSTALSL